MDCKWELGLEKRSEECTDNYPERSKEIHEICSDLLNKENSPLVCYGESGCGKTSILKSLLPWTKPFDGPIKVSWISLAICKDSKHVLRTIWHHIKSKTAVHNSQTPTKFVQLATMLKEDLIHDKSMKILLVLEGIQKLRGMDEDLTLRLLHLNKVTTTSVT